jgi:hypothetical protein
MVCVVFTIVAVAGLCWANGKWFQQGGTVQLVGKVVKGSGGQFVLKTGEGDFVLRGPDSESGADASPWVNKKVKASGAIFVNPTFLKKRFKADKFEAAE